MVNRTSNIINRRSLSILSGLFCICVQAVAQPNWKQKELSFAAIDSLAILHDQGKLSRDQYEAAIASYETIVFAAETQGQKYVDSLTNSYEAGKMTKTVFDDLLNVYSHEEEKARRHIDEQHDELMQRMALPEKKQKTK